MKVLVVDDHAETRQLLVRTLAGEGHRVLAAGDCSGAAAAVGDDEFDVIILDVMLPDGSGVDLARRLREDEVATPILLLTARGGVRDRVAGLDAGADDYLAKPFAVSELRARLRALVRRGPALRVASVRAGPMTVDLARRRVTVHAEHNIRPVPLTAREYAIVELLSLRRGAVVARDELLESVWGEISDSANASLEVLMTRIRRKLGPAAGAISTVRGMGYVLETVP
jgi:two-component system OmpR family response regulator